MAVFGFDDGATVVQGLGEHGLEFGVGFGPLVVLAVLAEDADGPNKAIWADFAREILFTQDVSASRPDSSIPRIKAPTRFPNPPDPTIVVPIAFMFLLCF